MKDEVIYEGKYLRISYNNTYNRLIQLWISPPDIQGFKKEMQHFRTVFMHYIPKQVLWIQDIYTLELKEDDYHWIEQNINVPCWQISKIKCAFIMGKDALAHVHVIKSFKEVNSCIPARHFSKLEDALSYFDETERSIDTGAPSFSAITFEGFDEHNNAIITIKAPADQVISTLENLKIHPPSVGSTEEQFKLTSLSRQEHKVFALYTSGKKHQDIADDLFISLHTVRTHWRNIKKKLGIKTFLEALEISRNFQQKITH